MDSLLIPVLPKGLKICRQGQSVETAASNAGDVALLATTRGLELVRGTLKKGFRLHLYPSEDACRTTEIYICSTARSASTRKRVHKFWSRALTWSLMAYKRQPCLPP